VQIAAVSKDQTRNTMTLMSPMMSADLISDFGIDPGKEIIHSRAGGRIEAVTSSPRALEGGRPTFVIANETHHWLENNEGLEMGKAIARNLAKSRDGSARSLALTNAHDPGEGSVAELDWEAWAAMQDGRSRATGFLYDSLEAPADTQLAPRFVDDMSDAQKQHARDAARESLRAGLVAARGDSTWLDVDRLIEEIYDPATPASMSRRFYLNQLVASEDAWIAPHEWGECADATQSLADGDMVTLGFDGSVREDSTALVACRVEDGFVQLLGCWEKPDGPAGDDWQVDRVAVDAAVYRAHDQFKVIGFYCDPPFFQDYVDKWAAEFAVKLRVRASQARPLEWWTNRPKAMVDALERFHEAAVSRQLVHDGDATLTRHVLNARRRVGRSGITISKENPSSPRKIDAAMAAVLAYEARADAVTLGFARPRRKRRAHGF
jgi:phage terminase large subunit-like protein